MNNQTETTKRKGSRVFALFTVLCLVVAMAVPAFAATADGYWTFGKDVTVNYFPEEEYSCNWRTGDGSTGNKIVFRKSVSGIPSLHLYNGTTDVAYAAWFNDGRFNVSHLGELYIDGEFSDGLRSELNWCGFYHEPPLPPAPPPDLGEVTTDTLPVVLGWIQSVITAIFVGEMNGFLILAAVPVAIVIVFLGARLLRRLFWGA